MPPRLPASFLFLADDWANLPNRPGSATDRAVDSVNRSRNTGIDREADDFAAAVADLNEELARA